MLFIKCHVIFLSRCQRRVWKKGSDPEWSIYALHSRPCFKLNSLKTDKCYTHTNTNNKLFKISLQKYMVLWGRPLFWFSTSNVCCATYHLKTLWYILCYHGDLLNCMTLTRQSIEDRRRRQIQEQLCFTVLKTPKVNYLYQHLEPSWSNLSAP